MLNQCILVGRLVRIKEDIALIKVASNEKNASGKYKDYIIKTRIFGEIGENMKAYCKNNAIVGIKGHLTSGNEIVVEKVTFLSERPKK